METLCTLSEFVVEKDHLSEMSTQNGSVLQSPLKHFVSAIFSGEQRRGGTDRLWTLAISRIQQTLSATRSTVMARKSIALFARRASLRATRSQTQSIRLSFWVAVFGSYRNKALTSSGGPPPPNRFHLRPYSHWIGPLAAKARHVHSPKCRILEVDLSV